MAIGDEQFVFGAQGALWLAVKLSVALVAVQLRSNCHGGVQVTIRQTTGPYGPICWLHWP
jgi:hypothetical protein